MCLYICIDITCTIVLAVSNTIVFKDFTKESQPHSWLAFSLARSVTAILSLLGHADTPARRTQRRPVIFIRC